MQGQAPSAAFMAKLCQSLGISGEWLLSGQGPMKVRDMKTHALKNADANELMGAIASTLTQVIERVDRLDRFVQMIETKLNASAMVEHKAPSDILNFQQNGSVDGTSGSRTRTESNDESKRSSAERIAGAIAKRSSDHDD